MPRTFTWTMGSAPASSSLMKSETAGGEMSHDIAG